MCKILTIFIVLALLCRKTDFIVNHVVLNIRAPPNHFIIFKLGTNKWYFFNDNACLTEENKVADNVYIEDINFSTCGTNEFNCFDGTW